LATLEICHRDPRGTGDRTDCDRALGSERPQDWQHAPGLLIRRIELRAVRPIVPASRTFEGFPSFVPVALRTPNVALVRSEISRRSFSAKAA
jgi:hypothetical protein